MASSVLMVVLGVLGLVLFVVPHHGPKSSGKRPSLARTSAEIVGEKGRKRWLSIVGLILILGCTGVFMPAATLAAAQGAGPAWGRIVLGAAGVVMLGAAPATWLLIELSVTSFMFGASRLAKPNVLATVIPVFVGACGVASLLLAAWGWGAAWAIGGQG